MEDGGNRPGHQSSSTEVAAIELGVPLASPRAKARDNADFVAKNRLQESQETFAKDFRKSSLQGESICTKQKKVSNFTSFSEKYREGKRMQEDLVAASSSKNI